MKVVICIDSFKGSLGSVAAGEAAAEGIRRAVPGADCRVRPLADGGEGTVAALVDGLGGETRSVRVTGPAGRPVDATYGLLPDGVAVLEMAEAAGITLVSGAERNPLYTTTYGVGEMILDAAENGATKFVIGIGGSATNDGGAGMLQALGYRLLDLEGRDLPRGGAALANLVTIIPSLEGNFASRERSTNDGRRETRGGLSFRIACDVTNPLCGERGASAVFGPQKGATPEMVRELDAALAHFSDVFDKSRDHHSTTTTQNYNFATFPGAGAAGGLGFAFKAFLGAELVPGVELILRETKLEDEIRDADVVVTGEGRLDGQTVMGKAPIGVARLAKKYGKPVVAFCGSVGDGVGAVNGAGIDAYFPILRRVGTLGEALDVENAAANLAATAEQVFRLWNR